MLGLALIVIISVANLRGIKESGRVFAVPTYIYIVMVSLLVGLGLFESFFGHLGHVPFNPKESDVAFSGGSLGIFLILKGFSSGAVALTGVEAISNGVPAFRRPESKNAAKTLMVMAFILGTLFFGVSVLAHRTQPYPSHDQTVFSQMGLLVFGNGPVYVVLQFATAAILTLAANTAYADFPRLSSIIARDGYLPRQFANRGDRLVFSNGVLFLAGAAGVLIVAFGGLTNKLIPLYAVGVFTIVHALPVRHGPPSPARSTRRGTSATSLINGFGSVATGIVTVIIAATKFTEGAWIVLVIIPLIILLFRAIHRHYKSVSEGLAVTPDFKVRKMNHTVVVLVGSVHRGVLEALAYAKSLRPNKLLALSVVSDEEEQAKIEAQWQAFDLDVPLEILYSPYRELARPVLRYVDELDAQRDNDIVTVVIPEFVVGSRWGQLLHNQSALFLKGRLLFRKNTVVTSVPYHVEELSRTKAREGDPPSE